MCFLTYNVKILILKFYSKILKLVIKLICDEDVAVPQAS